MVQTYKIVNGKLKFRKWPELFLESEHDCFRLKANVELALQRRLKFNFPVLKFNNWDGLQTPVDVCQAVPLKTV